jgi:hypothetical protein
MIRYAEVKDGKVINTVVWDGVTKLADNSKAQMVLLPTYVDERGVIRHTAGIGWDYIDGEFIDNRPPVEDEE